MGKTKLEGPYNKQARFAIYNPYGGFAKQHQNHIMKAYVQPTPADVHVNAALTALSIAFLQRQSAFVADRVFANIPVTKQADQYFSYDRGEFNRDEMEERAPAAQTVGGSYKVDKTPNYFARVYGIHKDIPDQVRSNEDGPINSDRDATNYVTMKALIKRELSWRNAYFVAGNPGDTWTFDVDGDSSATAAGSFDPTNASNNQKVYWSSANSTPVEDIRQGKRFVQEATGFRPNVLTVGRVVFDTLADHPDIVGRLDRGQTSGPAIATAEAMAALLELDEILVMDSIQNTAAKGAAAVHSFIGGKNALLSYRPPEPGLLTPSAGYTFSWTGLLGATLNGIRIKRFRMEPEASDRVEAEQAFDQKLISKDLGYFFGGIVE